MALSGTHITCGFVGSPPAPALMGAAQWSTTMAAAGVTALAASLPASTPPGVTITNLAFEVRPTVDIYVAVGKNPDASQANGSGDSARIFCPANETRNIFCAVGDKLAWIGA
jgi:hypothetical protein